MVPIREVNKNLTGQDSVCQQQRGNKIVNMEQRILIFIKKKKKEEIKKNK